MISSRFRPVDLLRLALAAAVAAALAGLAASALAAGPKAYVGNFKDDSVSVVDTAAGTVLSTVPVAAGPDGIVVARDGKSVYVSGSSATGVSLIDAGTDKVVQTIETGKGPQGLALTPDGRSVLVAVNGGDLVAVIDTTSRTVVASIPLAKPHTIAVAPDGKTAYVASQAPGNFALVIIDLARRAVVGNVALDKPPRDLEFGNDGKALYFTLAGVPAVQVLDPATRQVVAQVPTGVSPHIAQWFRHTLMGVVVVQGPGELMLFDPATNAPGRSIPVGKQPHWVDASADGTHLFVTNEGSDSVSAIDLAGGETRTIAVGHAPRKIAVQPTGSSADGSAAKVSIANFAFEPAKLTVHAGDTVRWTNADGAPHGVAFQDGAPGEALMLPGATFSRRFDHAGVFAYACSVHPYMTAQVTVQ